MVTIKKLRKLMRGTAKQKKTAKAEMSQNGFNKLYCAMEHIKGVNPNMISPRDPMHVLFDGVTRYEAAWLIYVLCKAGLNILDLRKAIASYPRFPADVRIPPLSLKLKCGTKEGKPCRDRVLSMSASQVMHFTLHR